MLDTLSTNISNLVSLLLHSLKFSSLFPALVFVILNESFILSLISQYWSIDLGDEFAITQLVLLTLFLTVLIGYTLSVLNFFIIQLFEGYPFRLTWLGRAMACLQKRRKHQLEAILRELEVFIPDELPELPAEVLSDTELMSKRLEHWIKSSDLFKYVERERAVCGTTLQTDFPSHDSEVAPTSLGNAIAAFEDYPRTRYGIDAVFLWPRLVPILSQEKYAIFVEKEKAGLDFLLNLSFLIGIFAIQCVVLKVSGTELSALIPATALVAAYLLYRGAVRSAANWGETVKVAFDLYRYQLGHQLSIARSYNLTREFARWQGLSQFIVKGESFDEFDYPLPKDPQPKAKG